MRYARILAVLGLCLIPASYAHAQRFSVSVGIGGPVYVGPPPVCEYGYYNYYPYACAPYGYYGPEWFSSGVFIGAGPWYGRYYGGRGYYGGRRYYPSRGFEGRHDWDRGHFRGDSGFRGGLARRGGDFRGGHSDGHGHR